jgi:ribose 5-phosphate isomerase A
MEIIELAKQKASIQAVNENVSETTQILGIGSGSTIVYAVQELAKLYHANKTQIKAFIPSSYQSLQLIIEHKLPLGTLNEHSELDLTFDGCDEIDSNLNCIKGGGACHFQEKLLINNSKNVVLICDYTKESALLCTKYKRGIPVEVLPLSLSCVLKNIQKIKGFVGSKLRMSRDKAGPVITDNGMFCVDVDFGGCSDPLKLHLDLINITGVIETGIFCDVVDKVYFGLGDGTVKNLNKNGY